MWFGSILAHKFLYLMGTLCRGQFWEFLLFNILWRFWAFKSALSPLLSLAFHFHSTYVYGPFSLEFVYLVGILWRKHFWDFLIFEKKIWHFWTLKKWHICSKFSWLPFSPQSYCPIPPNFGMHICLLSRNVMPQKFLRFIWLFWA